MAEHTDFEIAEYMILSGFAKNFIVIALGMIDDPGCDLNGKTAYYANKMDELKEKAVHELDEIKD